MLLGTFIAPHPPLIIPEVGRGEERTIQKTIDAYDKIAQTIAYLSPETMIVISPHSVMYSDYIHISPGSEARGDLGQFGARNTAFHEAYDSDFVAKLSENAEDAEIPAGTMGERNPDLDHGVMVPLYFVEKHITDCRLVRISISGLSPLDHYRFGRLITKTSEELNRRIVIIASGDLSHKLKEDGPYGFAEEGPQFDSEVTSAMAAGDFMKFLTFDEAFCDAAAECGLRSFIEMAGALDGMAVSPHLLSYEGPFGVGYAVCEFDITGSDSERKFGDILKKDMNSHLKEKRGAEDAYVRLARQSLEAYIKTGKMLKLPADLDKEMADKSSGVFVSIKKDGRLRGCIGTISPMRPCIADEIIHNAVSAGTQDPRFDPIAANELDALEYSVDVLDKPEPISDPSELDAERYGVIVTKGNRRGLLLPNLEGVKTPQQQIRIALQKAEISPSENYSIERFEVVRHH